MTCPEQILNLLTTAKRTGELQAALPHAASTVWDALRRLRQAKCIRKVRRGVWVRTGRPYEPAKGLRSPDGVLACAEALGISRQRAYMLIRSGLAWKEGDTWKRKHTKPGRPV